MEVCYTYCEWTTFYVLGNVIFFLIHGNYHKHEKQASTKET